MESQHEATAIEIVLTGLRKCCEEYGVSKITYDTYPDAEGDLAIWIKLIVQKEGFLRSAWIEKMGSFSQTCKNELANAGVETWAYIEICQD